MVLEQLVLFGRDGVEWRDERNKAKDAFEVAVYQRQVDVPKHTI